MSSNVLLVKSSNQVKEIRGHLEGSGYYDSSRSIQRINSTFSGSSDNYFAIPITTLCITHLDQPSPLPTPYTDCLLAHAQLPLSKKARAKSQMPYQILREAVRSFLVGTQQCTVEDIETLLMDVPRSWERHSDLVVLSEDSFSDSRWQKHLQLEISVSISKEMPFEPQTDNGGVTMKARTEGTTSSLLNAITVALNCRRLAIDRSITCDSYRSSGASLLLGDDGWVEHVDNGVRYVFDVTKCMFSSGNISEKLRVASFNCKGETVVDLYAGIGYFTLPYLVHTGAAMVHACEWNSHAVEALERGLRANNVHDRCVIHHGDNQKVAPVGVADRVNLGLVPSSEGGWAVACRALRQDTGGWMHVHGNVSSKFKTGSLSKQSSNGTGAESNPWEMISIKANKRVSDECFCKNSYEQLKEQSSSAGQGEVHCVCDQQRMNETTSSQAEIENKSEPLTGGGAAHKSRAAFTQEVSTDTSQDGTTNHTEQDLTSSKAFHESKAPTKRELWEGWARHVAGNMLELLRRDNLEAPVGGKDWKVIVGHLEHVKSYAPHVDHIVVDLECRPTNSCLQLYM